MKLKILLISSFFSLLLFPFAFIKHYLLGNDIADIGFFQQFTWLIANGGINEASSLAYRTPLQDHLSLFLTLQEAQIEKILIEVRMKALDTRIYIPELRYHVF